MSASLLANILFVTEEDAEYSHALYIFNKYHFSNSILRLRRPLELRRYFSEFESGDSVSGTQPPELVLFSAIEPSLGQLSSTVEFIKLQIKDVPLIVVAENAEAEKAIRGLNLQTTYVIGKPLGFFKLLEAMQKLGMYWTVKRLPG